MTGRELILYILSNGLENEPVFKDGKFIGFLSAGEAASKMNVGVATIYVLASQGKIQGSIIGNTLYIPANFEASLDSTKGLKGVNNNG